METTDTNKPKSLAHWYEIEIQHLPCFVLQMTMMMRIFISRFGEPNVFIYLPTNVERYFYGSRCSIPSQYRIAYKITFNTIDNLIWKPQQTEHKRMMEENHWTMFWFAVFSIYGNSFSLLFTFSARFFISSPLHFSSLFLFPFLCARRKMLSKQFRRSVYGQSKAVLISAYWALRLGFIRFYLSNKHLTNIRDLS